MTDPPRTPLPDPAAEPLDPPQVLAVGDAIGRYRIRERVGEGGMGVVYAAEDPELGRLVAIKVLRPVHGSEAEVHQKRMMREAQALARVSHRNLVTIFDVGSTEDGRVWVAMEYVEGDTLDAWLAAERRNWREVVDVFIEAALGLAAVHEAGLIHRDFKPGNVIVGKGGSVQVLDFGLAAQAGERIEVDPDVGPRARPALDALAATLTETGGLMGTPAYMAPEQFLHAVVDARSDQFGFSVALYEALYGHRPFKGKDLADLMLAAVEGLPERPPPLPGVPDALRKIIDRGLRPDPSDRFKDMHALVRALERTRPSSQTAGGWRRFVLGFAVGGGVLAAAAVAWAVRDGSDATFDATGETDTDVQEPVADEGPVVPDDHDPPDTDPFVGHETEALPGPVRDTELPELPSLDDLEGTTGTTGDDDTTSGAVTTGPAATSTATPRPEPPDTKRVDDGASPQPPPSDDPPPPEPVDPELSADTDG
jgi:predicted Ser/Thr protein kinase